MRGKYWKSICAIPAYMFLLSPSGKRVQKMEGGNWIDKNEAQKVVDSAEDELSDLRAELAGLKTGYEAYDRVNAELRDECEALRKDADRYRFLRDANDDLIAACSIGEDSITFLGDIELDQHIDAAMIDGATQ